MTISSPIRDFLKIQMKFDLQAIDERLSQKEIGVYKQDIEIAIVFCVEKILEQLQSNSWEISILGPVDSPAESKINDYCCRLLNDIDNSTAHETMDSLRHSFCSFAFGGIHQLYTRQENEVWYPKIVINSEIEPNDISSLPAEIRLYRGTNLEEFKTLKYGQSWTTDKSVAYDFAFKHYQSQPWFNEDERAVLSTVYPKSGVFYSMQRCEFEVVIDINKITNIQCDQSCNSVGL